jgi:signal transduction histidine kinase
MSRVHAEPPNPKFTEDHLALAIALAHQAALAVEGTRYYQAMVQAERLAAVGQTIAALSHHIKNILQGLRSGTEILGMGIGQKDDELLQQGWRIVEKNQGKIYGLVLDMLSYSKEREPALEATDLNALAAEVVELLKARAEELKVTLTTRPAADLPITPADPEGIHRALLNLVGNALDAAEDRPDAKVEVATELEAGGEWVRIVVRDNGVGIPPDRIADIFKPFVSTKGSRGTGLGLAVSRKVLREHGGDILVESQEGEGSTFVMRLPLTSHSMPDPTTPAPVDPRDPD